MQIILDDSLIPQPEENDYSLDRKVIGSLRDKLTKYHWSTKFNPIDEVPNSNLHNTGLIGMLSEAYSKHLKVTLNPHDIWVVLMSEIVRAVSLNPENYRHLFTNSKEKELITVLSNSSTHIPIDLLSSELSKNVLFDSNMLFPQFSTNTPIINETIQAMFCDMAAPFYDYGMFMCGIPAIKLGGTQEDWTLLKNSFNTIVETFKDQQLKDYSIEVNIILDNIISTFIDNEKYTDFWKDIFTMQNKGSGSDLFINGWIKKLFLKDREINKITNYTSSHGIVEYSQLDTGRKFAVLYGGLSMLKDTEEFYELQYASYVYEIIESTDRK